MTAEQAKPLTPYQQRMRAVTAGFANFAYAMGAEAGDDDDG